MSHRIYEEETFDEQINRARKDLNDAGSKLIEKISTISQEASKIGNKIVSYEREILYEILDFTEDKKNDYEKSKIKFKELIKELEILNDKRDNINYELIALADKKRKKMFDQKTLKEIESNFNEYTHLSKEDKIKEIENFKKRLFSKLDYSIELESNVDPDISRSTISKLIDKSADDFIIFQKKVRLKKIGKKTIFFDEFCKQNSFIKKRGWNSREVYESCYK